MDLVGRTIGEVVAEDYRLGAVFKQYGLDFCCGGGKLVHEACATRGIDVDELSSALDRASRGRSGEAAPDARNWDPAFLADYIVNVHHTYVRESLPTLQFFSHKVARVHGHAAPEVVAVAEKVHALASELEVHLEREENELFPLVRHLSGKSRMGDPQSNGTGDAPLDLLRDEHEHAGETMQEIRDLTSGFTPPEWACNTFRALYAKLEEFEEDLHRHVHLENNVLFPNVLRMHAAVAG